MFKEIITVVATVILILMLIALIAVKEDRATNKDIRVQQLEIYKAKESIIWKHTKHGTKYYIDCINGVEYIGTKSTHNYVQFTYTGVICDVVENE